MKNSILTFVTLLLIGFGNTYAANNTSTTTNKHKTGEAFTFIESGITFSVFQNGEFDFYLNQPNRFSANYYNNGMSISFNAGYNYDAYVQYDRFGAVIQIQNVPIYYDNYGRISQVGSININYYNGRLARLGGMQIYYNNYGSYAYYRGYINTYNRNYVYHPYHNYFTRPNYDYCVVSYKPYRKNYKEQRYTYYKDHSKNKYYSNYNSYNKHGKTTKYNNQKSHENRQRVVTNSIPKHKENNNVNNSRNHVKSSDFSKNERGNYNRTTTNNNRQTATVQHRNTERSTIERSPIKQQVVKRNLSSVPKNDTKNSSATTNMQHRKSNALSTKESTVNSKTKRVYSRKPVSKEVDKRMVASTSRRTF